MLYNVAVQCPGCNQMSGEQYRFGIRLDEVHGPGTAAEVEQLARAPMRHTIKQLEILEKHWADAVQQLDRDERTRMTHADNSKT